MRRVLGAVCCRGEEVIPVGGTRPRFRLVLSGETVLFVLYFDNTLYYSCEIEEGDESHICKLCVYDTPIACYGGYVLMKDIDG